MGWNDTFNIFDVYVQVSEELELLLLQVLDALAVAFAEFLGVAVGLDGSLNLSQGEQGLRVAVVTLSQRSRNTNLISLIGLQLTIIFIID